ncbi:MAG: FHA domain-containing protein [Vicinamibacteria bacterium]|nr:FHA domain-containing protein [Vicinamibacteria bacterium]
MARLIWKKTDSPEDDISFDLGEAPLVVGRDPNCGIFINAPLLSREHARIEFKDGAHVVTDLDSTNFTKVNGERVTEKPLKAGDRIHFSRAVCVYEA